MYINKELNFAAPSLVPATFRELGPPDVCHVVKSTGRAGQHDVGRPASFAFSRPSRRLTGHDPDPPAEPSSTRFADGLISLRLWHR
ncbi:hypothetical protein BC827DRAFT_1227707, partial [Russula dissimulans]